MSLMNIFTGGANKKMAGFAAGAANSELTDGYNRASATLSKSLRDQLDSLRGGYGRASSALDAGERSSTEYLKGGYDKARSDIGSGYDAATGNVTDYYDRSKGMLDPYIQRGGTLADLYSTALGAKGADAQRAFYNNYATNDPYRQFRDEQANRAIAASMNARGLNNSGRAGLAVSRASLERGSQDMQQYLDRLNQGGQQGGQYAQTLASLANQTGQTLANLNSRRGETLGSLETSRGQSLASNATNYANQRSQYGYNFGRDEAAANQGYAGAQAGLDYQVAQGRAGNHIGYGNAYAAANNAVANNLIGFGSTLMTGFTPGKYGTSTFGNIANSFKGGGIQ